MSKVIVHIDLNMFFVRCEIIKNPSLEGKPVAVGHVGRSGIVSTCSYEARKQGVHSGQPMFQATKACKDLIIVPGDYHFYEAKSMEFINFVKSYTKLVEVASIDECYADFTDALKDVKDIPAFFKTLQEDLLKKTSLMCSIGIAPNKFLAKMGSDYKKPMGITIIRKRDVDKILYPLPIKDFFGIGKKTCPKLEMLGIKTIGDLAEKCNEEDHEVKNLLGKFFYVVKDWCNGIGDDEIDIEPWDPKSIGNSTTLMHDSMDFEEIRGVISHLAKKISQRAKIEGKVGTTIQISVKDTDFKTYSKSVSFETPSNDAKFIENTASKLYENNYLGLTIRLVGVTLQNLINKKDAVIQMTLFDYEEHIEESQTKLLINELNKRFDKPLLKRASEVEDDVKHK